MVIKKEEGTKTCRGTGTRDQDDKDVKTCHDKRLSKSSSSSSLKKSILDKLGPGIITGASDADPSGIATYSQAGAQFGFGMAWLVLVLYPMITAGNVCKNRYCDW